MHSAAHHENRGRWRRFSAAIINGVAVDASVFQLKIHRLILKSKPQIHWRVQKKRRIVLCRKTEKDPVTNCRIVESAKVAVFFLSKIGPYFFFVCKTRC